MPVKDEGYCVYGAGVITRRIEALAVEIEGVRQAKDIEYIHRMRVASRRLRAALPLFESCFPARRFEGWVKEIRRITRALGAARDTDVQIDVVTKFSATQTDPAMQPGLRRLLLRLRQQRSKLQEQVNSALDQLVASGVLTDIQNRLAPVVERANQTYLYTPYTYQQAYETIASRLQEFLSYEEYIYRPECITELHAMRIAAKRLRYTMEIFASIYPGELKEPLQAIRKIQDSLGEIHDADVWDLFLNEFLEKEAALTQEYFGNLRSYRRTVPGILRFQEDRQHTRNEMYQKFLTDWEKMNRQGVWQNLLPALQIPYHLGEQPAQPAAASKKAEPEVKT